MTFDCLILCDELESLGVLCKVLDLVGIQKEICTEPGDARAALTRRRFQALMVDCDDMAGSKEFIQAVRQGNINNSAVLFAIVNGATSVRQAFEMGANFVLSKPVALDLTARSLWEAQGQMLREQRRSFRQPVEMLALVDGEHGNKMPFSVRNLSEGGMGLRDVKTELRVGEAVTVRFQLPDVQVRIACSAEVVWMTKDGHAGLRFLQLEFSSRSKLAQWLSDKFEQQTPKLLINAAKV